MFVVQIAAFLILILGLAWKFRVQLVEAIPVGVALLILMLYLLAFFRGLSASDYIAVAVIGAAMIYFFRVSGEKRRDIVRFAREELLSPGALTAFVMVILVTVCVSGKVVSWWDDYNFWATDAKALFYLDGFADKYANVAAEFGDYPPGTQLMKWWFTHFYPEEFKEGLMFAGYYFVNLAFLFPMLKIMKRKNVILDVLQMAVGMVVLWLFPAVAEGFWLDGCCADLTMALVYGAFLVSVADRKGKGRLFYYGRQALFLMVLVLCKNTGFIWAAFGLLFDYGYHVIQHGKENDREGRKKDRQALLIVTFLPVLTEMSWLGFCFLNRRVAKLTGAAVQMATGRMNIPAYQGEMVKAFAEAFFIWPLHKWKTIAIDITPLGLYLLLLVLVALLYRCHLLDKKTACYTGGFFAVTGIVFYTFNLISHLTIFAVETQYLQPFGMISSIERYGAPFTIGGLYLMAFYAMSGKRPAAGAVVCSIFVLLTTDYGGAYRGIWGYQSTVNEVISQREEIVDEQARVFLETVAAGEKEGIGRVLYLRDISDVSWVRNTYIGFEAAPVSVMYGNVDGASMSSPEIEKAIEDAHAGFLYVDVLAEELFAPFMEDKEKFESGCLYQVMRENGGIRLIKCKKG